MGIVKKIKITIVTITLLWPLNLDAQAAEETSFQIKLLLFQESPVAGMEMNKELLSNFMKLEFTWDTLRADNFEDFFFLSISPIFKNPMNLDLTKLPFVRDNCKEYVIAINKNKHRVYRLKGFIMNDFSSFLDALKSNGYEGVNTYNKFISNYRVDELDLKCLYRAFSSYRRNKEKYPCLLNCSELFISH